MNDLAAIERQLRTLLPRLNFRPTLDRAVLAGELLRDAKALLPHGQWLPWLRVRGLPPRTAQVYLQVAEQIRRGSAYLPQSLSINQFLMALRKANRQGRRDALDEARRAAAAAAADLPAHRAYRVVHADCRRFRWPEAIDLVATDPPWPDHEAYRWLAGFAATHLRPGGLLVCQCGNVDIPEVLDILRAGLSYVWTLCMAYQKANYPSTCIFPPFQPYWRPVLVFCRGDFGRTKIQTMSDTYTVTAGNKQQHPWEQPLLPWQFWLYRLSLPGALIADPFGGMGTIGVAVKSLGQRRRYLGTEIDPENAAAARHNIAQAKAGSYRPRD